MANALGQLFGDIANAIRSKTGEEGKMKPAEFPAKIGAIEVGGGSSGGGSLSAGMYLSRHPIPSYSNSYYALNRFKFNGELYEAVGASTNNSNCGSIVKWNGSTWDVVAKSAETNGFTPKLYTSEIANGLMYKGKWHFVSGYGSAHASFDGTTWESVSTLPSNKDGGGSWVKNDSLYVLIKNKVYVFDDDTSTWNLSYIAPFDEYAYPYVYNYGNDTYVSADSVLYRVNEGAFEQLATLSRTINNGVVAEGHLYFFVGNSSNKSNDLGRVSLEDYSEVIVGSLPYGCSFTFAQTGELSGIAYNTNHSNKPHFLIHIVEE